MFAYLLNKLKKNSIKSASFYCIFLILLVMPFFWFPQDLYLLGEDDTGLAYYNSLGTMEKFSSAWFSADSLAVFNPSMGGELMFSFFLYIIKLITFEKINLQLLSFGFILSFSFLYIVKILELINNNSKTYAYYVAGIFYALSSYFTMVEYYYLMPSTYVIVLAPVLLFYLLQSIKLNSNIPLLIGALWSFFLSRAMITPTFVNYFALLFVFIILWSYSNRGAAKVTGAIFSYFKLIIFIFLINMVIVVPVFYSYMMPGSNAINDAVVSRSASSAGMINNLEAELKINKNYSYLINLFPSEISKVQGFRNYEIYDKYLDKTSPLMFVIIILAFVGMVCIPKQKIKVLVPILATVIISYLFLSVDIFYFFEKFYIYLMSNTSFFNMNRYPSMKFHIPFVLFYSLLVGVSLYYLFNRISAKYSRILFGICLIILVAVNYSFISGAVFTTNLQSVNTKRILDFNDDYKKLVKDFSSYVHDDAKLLLFPLGYGYGAFISGQDESQIYRSTVTGFKNFTGYNLLGNLIVLGAMSDPSIYFEAKKYYFEDDLQSLFDLAKKLNIKYVIYSKKLDDLKKYGEIISASTYENAFYYDPVDLNSLVYENDGYSIYKVKNYDSISEFSSDNLDTEIYFKKVSDFMYLLKIKTNNIDNIKMHESFSELWKLYEIENQDFTCDDYVNYAKKYPNIYECKHQNSNFLGNLSLLKNLSAFEYEFPHERAENFINSWKINTDGEYTYIAVVMDGQKYLVLGAILSFVVLLIFTYLIYSKLSSQ